MYILTPQIYLGSFQTPLQFSIIDLEVIERDENRQLVCVCVCCESALVCVCVCLSPPHTTTSRPHQQQQLSFLSFFFKFPLVAVKQ